MLNNDLLFYLIDVRGLYINDERYNIEYNIKYYWSV